MPVESNMAIVRRFFDEVFNSRNISLVDELVSPGFINHNASIQVRVTERVKGGILAQFQTYPDIHTPIEDIISEGDKVVVGARDHFIPQPNGKPIELTWIEIIRLGKEKLVEA